MLANKYKSIKMTEPLKKKKASIYTGHIQFFTTIPGFKKKKKSLSPLCRETAAQKDLFGINIY